MFEGEQLCRTVFGAAGLHAAGRCPQCRAGRRLLRSPHPQPLCGRLFCNVRRVAVGFDIWSNTIKGESVKYIFLRNT